MTDQEIPEGFKELKIPQPYIEKHGKKDMYLETLDINLQERWFANLL